MFKRGLNIFLGAKLKITPEKASYSSWSSDQFINGKSGPCNGYDALTQIITDFSAAMA